MAGNELNVLLNLLNFLKSRGVNQFYTPKDIVTQNYDEFFRIYINFPNQSCLAHRFYCPDKMIIPAGLVDVKDTGLWIGYFKISEIEIVFSSVANFVDSIANLLFGTNRAQNKMCQRCW